MRFHYGLVLSFLFFISSVSYSAGPRDDRFLEGYVSAMLDMRFGLRNVIANVENGRLVLDPAQLKGQDPQTVADVLSTVEGLQVVVGKPGDRTIPTRERHAGTHAASASEKLTRYTGWLPPTKAFDALIADPKWPRFSASIQFYQSDEELNTVGSANFGATLPFYGWEGLGAIWQVGLQASVFSIFNLNASSTDLVNSDFFVALPLSVRSGPFSAQTRIFHQSSHLGDEYLLRNRVNRINLSFEGFDLLLSWNFGDVLRVYGGGGGLFRTDPGTLKPWFTQGGFELTSPYPLWTELLYPVAALDVQAAEGTDWNPGYSARAGVEFRSAWLEGRRLQWLFEYFNGRSPNGQFFERHIEYFGTGLHFYF
ncbi:uncharacterized protein sS8_4734 [Methylocaldum marinum]|uniref:DUF1207 domain-containing protein n=1 Tax=Methylocaldum marinum TaxID=1432792 RepID=A0A250KYA4_9GAMM|nr:DUF1207 domain-containing protein [Methylocaldum marinum]BBA36658.1 uncharacterized protein sS8_4734 [Methylocaldum marinum]